MPLHGHSFTFLRVEWLNKHCLRFLSSQFSSISPVLVIKNGKIPFRPMQHIRWVSIMQHVLLSFDGNLVPGLVNMHCTEQFIQHERVRPEGQHRSSAESGDRFRSSSVLSGCLFSSSSSKPLSSSAVNRAGAVPSDVGGGGEGAGEEDNE